MKKMLLIGCCVCSLIFSNCERKNYVYSNASLNEAYEYDPAWDFRGYSPTTNKDFYRRYDPERDDKMVKNIENPDTLKN